MSQTGPRVFDERSERAETNSQSTEKPTEVTENKNPGSNYRRHTLCTFTSVPTTLTFESQKSGGKGIVYRNSPINQCLQFFFQVGSSAAHTPFLSPPSTRGLPVTFFYNIDFEPDHRSLATGKSTTVPRRMSSRTNVYSPI